MSKKSKLKKLDKKIQKKQIEKRKEDLSKLSTKELMAKRRGVDPKSESRADYVKRRKSEMSKPSPAKFLPILGAIASMDFASAFKMKGFGGYGNEPSPAKLAVAKIAVKAGAKAVKAVKKAYKSYKTSKQQSPKSYGGYGRKIDMENAIKRRKIGTGSN